MGATVGPAIVGEFLSHTVAKNVGLLSAAMTDVNPRTVHIPISQLFGMVQEQALVVSKKEIYGWLLIVAIMALVVISVSCGTMRPWAIFPKWKTVKCTLRRMVQSELRTT